MSMTSCACGAVAQIASPSLPSSSRGSQVHAELVRLPLAHALRGHGARHSCSRRRGTLTVRAIGGGAGGQSTFLSYEEAGLIEMSELDMHERFLCRLTVSSLNLLRIVSEQEGVPIEELNAGMICDWFQKDKVKREQDINSATLKWESGPEW
ncbi:hypothetical protein MPTK1_6g05870 [Marchantia polymorpha subsp. ruderalis]|uniref:Uncharacterized protein n=2 Tax=Marchantia polymorpha TaxID=3197 RepID=A0A176VQV8_MARPO|nr:hypothetical protein AXG93_2675s1050 [Marchantia polymorpha subsp. ruderalis]PTQ32581.1 hypothetical protein MARPO_0097s0056 [Marchantia polymorpha]BBN13730.1 hypothetical protein Mp_6g05870 [Marchantia polymorpha subsp. ruderalis]|eukprot:PTQ32581.1 hypothetical protein MARPO_0097s0056 [Marchantia polymorpha]